MKNRKKGKSQTLALVLLSVFSLNACRLGGSLTAGLDGLPNPVPSVDNPTIAEPAQQPFYSNLSELLIKGLCGVGQTVILGGDASSETTCSDEATYSFTVSKTVDGVYAFVISQKDFNNNISQSSSVVWIRKTSVAQVVLTSPPVQPYASSETTLNLSGECETGSLISVSGSTTESTECVNSEFQILIPQTIDGTYNYTITQTDLAGNSAARLLTWDKAALSASPAAPVIPVATQQVFVPNGGDLTYTFQITENNSGGTFDAATKTYTAGTLANVSDKILLTDSLGASFEITVSTVAGAADHLDIVAGDAQSVLPGALLSTTPQVRVSDRYGNGIPAISLLLAPLSGDFSLGTELIQTSNSSGLVNIPWRMGATALTSSLRIQPLSTTLPDLAVSGRSTLKLTQTVDAQGVGQVGLNFGTGSDPKSLVYADFNEDGIVDLGFINAGDNKVGISIGAGNGVFSVMAQYSLSSCSAPEAMAKGDFNEDGHVDLIIACYGSDSLARLSGNGGGGFSTLTTVASVTQPIDIEVADFNKDGFDDIAVVSYFDSLVRISTGSGSFTFSTSADYVTPSSPRGIAVGDINKDTYADFVTANSGDASVSVFQNAGDGTFLASVRYDVGQGPAPVLLADITGDSYLDIVTGNMTDNTLTSLVHVGTAMSFGADSTILVGQGPQSLYAADIDGNSTQDLAVVNNLDGTIGILLSQGNGTFASMVSYQTETSPASVVVTDLNDDTFLDFAIVAGTQFLQVFPGNSSGIFGLSNDVPNSPIAGVSGDFDEDGFVDQAVLRSGSNNIYFLKGNGRGLFEANGTATTASGPSEIIKTDLNFDGHIDLLVTNQTSNSVSFLAGRGDGTFDPRIDYPVSSSPTGLVAADFNKDGKIDIAVANSGAIVVSVLLATDSAGAFANKVDYAAGSSPSALGVGDINGDGAVDLAVAAASSDSVAILLGNGDGTLRAPVLNTVGTSPSKIILQDFTLDGILDVITLNSGENTLSILEGVGDGSFSTNVNFDGGGNLTGLSSGDFDGDGKLDLVTGNGPTQTFSLIKGNGTGVFNSPNPLNTNYVVNSVLVSDFTADGKLDISVFDGTSNKVHLWPGQ